MTAGTVPGATGEQSVMYVYGVARASPGRRFASAGCEGIVPEASVDPLVQGELTAFVSAVPADRFGASGFRSALKDVEWLKDRILAHEKVLEELMSSDDIVPFRFGTIYLDSSQVANALARHRAELRQALERIQGTSEWGVKVYCAADVLRCRIESESAAIRRLRGALAQASPGARFFLQKKYAKALDGEVAATIAGCVARIGRGLDAFACESTEVEAQPAAAHGRSADMVMNAAYLVTKGSLPQFRQTSAALRKECAAHGLELELTGPWPPYHFVSIRQEGVADAAASDQ